jgi:hypothetical protein
MGFNCVTTVYVQVPPILLVIKISSQLGLIIGLIKKPWTPIGMDFWRASGNLPCDKGKSYNYHPPVE